MALAAGSPAIAETSAQPARTTIAMNIPTLGLPAPAKWAGMQPALSSAAKTFATLAEKVAATEANLVAIDDQLRCLATAIYYEARSEPVEGQLAVAQVVRNRVRSGRFRNSLCGVVYQPSQFPFSRRAPSNRVQWERAVKVALIAMADGWREIVPNALYFHAARISPRWNRQRVARVGNNIFYR
jgi:spore germination cell wall hydrolase CwlJ-like protein